MAKTKGKLVGVTSMKGGVGKTIFTLQFAGVFASLQKRILIIDMDLYGGAIALNLNLKPEKTIYHYADDMSNNRYHDFRDYVTTFNEWIDIISCPKDPRQANKIDSKYVEMLLENALYRYDVVLLDMTHMLNKTNIMMLDMATQMIYLMTNDPMDLKNTKSFMAVLDDIEKDNVLMVLNNSKDPGLTYFSLFDIKNIIKHKIDYTISQNSHVKNITRYILDGELIGKETPSFLYQKKDIDHLIKMAKSILEEE